MICQVNESDLEVLKCWRPGALGETMDRERMIDHKQSTCTWFEYYIYD